MIVVIGGGPAGVFAAITAREQAPDSDVVVLEKNRELLGKVRVSGGGRCNVTHACFDPGELITHYPRGGRELRGPLTRFGPDATVAWFADRGVALKTEDDGRMFPVTDRSLTIVDALLDAARAAGVRIASQQRVTAIVREGDGFGVQLAAGETLLATRVLLATGGRTSTARDGATAADGYTLAAGLGHAIVAPVPSLFTFHVQDPLLTDLAGVVAMVELRIDGVRHTQNGPLLVTHRGVSGPAVIKLSAWAARELHATDYRFELAVSWRPGCPPGDLDTELQAWSREHGRQHIAGGGPGGLPRRLWAALVARAGIEPTARWADLGRAPRARLVEVLTHTRLAVTGQAANKEEFVTCGGVRLAEVDFRTMASRVRPGLYLAGEVLDIDGVTGGFNFQGCWTTGWLAGMGMAAAGDGG